MKKIKYLIGIIIICILVFIGIELFRKMKNEEIQEPTDNEYENIIIDEYENTISKDNMIVNDANTEQTNTQPRKEIETGEEFLLKAEKILSARGWAGASNNLIGLKANILYYYNKETKELKKIATGIEDIYYKTEVAEDITAKKANNSNILENLTFLIYE